MNEPTPGPWRVGPYFNGVYGPDHIVCNMTTKSGYIRNADANAHLIAAAPDMLKALKRIAAWEFNIMGDCVADAQALANAVIKQAEGRAGGG